MRRLRIDMRILRASVANWGAALAAVGVAQAVFMPDAVVAGLTVMGVGAILIIIASLKR